MLRAAATAKDVRQICPAALARPDLRLDVLKPGKHTRDPEIRCLLRPVAAVVRHREVRGIVFAAQAERLYVVDI